jgi:hypothetical protein
MLVLIHSAENLPSCPICRNTDTGFSFWHVEDAPAVTLCRDCAAFCRDCNLGITRDSMPLRKVGDRFAAIGRAGRVIFSSERFDSEENIEILCGLEEEAAEFGKVGDLSSEDARDAVWNAKRARRRFRSHFVKQREPLTIPDARKRALVERVIAEIPDSDEEFEHIESNVRAHLQDRAWEYEMARLTEPTLLLAEFPPPLRAIFNELVEAHRWGLNRAAIALCRLLLEELAWAAIESTGVSVLGKKGESWLFAALTVLHDKRIFSDREYETAVAIKDRGNGALHDVTVETPALETIQITLELLRGMAERGFLSRTN